MATVSLFDTIHFQSRNDDKFNLRCRIDLPQRYGSVSGAEKLCNPATVQQNLVWRAAKLLQTTANVNQGADIILIKRIPLEAGLGGASSDAAATLIAANRVWKAGRTKKQLAELAAEIGSDVPFFLNSGYALCRGRGEIVEPIAADFGIPIVICKPPEGLSTAKVFQNCTIGKSPKESKSFIEVLKNGDRHLLGSRLINRLEEASVEICGICREISCQFSQCGSLGHQISGSGTSYFGIFANQNSARQAANRLSARFPTSFVFVGSTLAPRRY